MKEYFPGIPLVTYQGGYTSHPFAFKFYDPERVVAGRPMREHFRFALPVGAVRRFGLEGGEYLMATMELLHKLGLQYYTVSDRALAAEGGSLRESYARLDEMADNLLCLQEAFQVRALRVHADLTRHWRYSYGAATSYSADVFAFAAAQTKHAMELAHRLNALHFCFAGQQETRGGFYLSVNDALETENLMHMLTLLRDYAAALGFAGQLCVRPHDPYEDNSGCAIPADCGEPYWPGAAHALAMLRHAGLDAFYRVDYTGGEPLSALRMLLQAQSLGLIDVPRWGNSWSLPPHAAMLELELLRAGGRQSAAHTTGMVLELPQTCACAAPEDYAIQCLMYMDACACGLLLAQRLLLDGRLEQFRRERYGGFGYGIGKAILENQTSFFALEEHALQRGDAQALTGRVEYLENVFQGMLCRGI